MSKRVLEYPLSFKQTTLSLPVGTEILTVHEQNEQVTLWAAVDETLAGDADPVERTFEVVPTGGYLPPRAAYVGTVFIDWTVWHVYEVR